MIDTVARPAAAPARIDTVRPFGRLGVVAYLNTRPLIDGLERLAGLDLRAEVPSAMADLVASRDVDAGLCSVVDFFRATEPVEALPVGALGCDGPTLTVRLFARRPLETVDVLHVDADSHTSVLLARLVMRMRFDREPALVPLRGAPTDDVDAMLLIGDKVVTRAPCDAAYPHQLDLGAAWKSLTGLPFVFALWMARRDLDPAVRGRLAMVLDRQRRFNRMLVEAIAHRHAAAHGWPADLAVRYLRDHLRFESGPVEFDAAETFGRLLVEHGILDRAAPLCAAEP